jgi:hypothetical protein
VWLLGLLTTTLLSNILEVIILIPILDVFCQFFLAEGSDDVLHVMRLAADQAAQVEDNTLSLVALAKDCGVGLLKLSKLLLVALALTLEFFSNLLLQNKGLKRIITLLLGPRETDGETRGVVLLLFDESRKTTSLALVILDLDLQLRGLLGELFGKGLEFEELR